MLLSDLLSGAASGSATTRAAPLGHDLARPHTAMVTAVDGPPDARAGRALLGVVQAVADRCHPRPLVTRAGEHVVVLWPDGQRGDGASAAADAVRTGARPALGGATATVVVGPTCDRVEDFRSAVATARGALELARLHGADRTMTLPDLGVYGLLLQLDDPSHLARFAERTLAPLRDHDERRGTLLVRTVRTYLDEDLNVARTAAALFVHPNTVGLRLKRVEELAQLSLHRPEALLELKVALMAEDVLGAAS